MISPISHQRQRPPAAASKQSCRAATVALFGFRVAGCPLSLHCPRQAGCVVRHTSLTERPADPPRQPLGCARPLNTLTARHGRTSYRERTEGWPEASGPGGRRGWRNWPGGRAGPGSRRRRPSALQADQAGHHGQEGARDLISRQGAAQGQLTAAQAGCNAIVCSAGGDWDGRSRRQHGAR